MIIPAILEDTFEKVEEKVREMEEVSPIIQIDVIDGTIIEGNTFLEIERLGLLESMSDITIHLMVKKPASYILRHNFFIPIIKRKIKGVSTVITQMVDDRRLRKFIKIAKILGYRVGLSINHDQDLSKLEPLLKDVSLVQFMSISPGKQGNEFIPSVLEKIREFKLLYPTMKTQVDGGINETTLPLVLEVGVDNIVVGSAIFSSEDPKETYLDLSSAHGTNIDTK